MPSKEERDSLEQHTLKRAEAQPKEEFDTLILPLRHYNSRGGEKIRGIVLHCLGYLGCEPPIPADEICKGKTSEDPKWSGIRLSLAAFIKAGVSSHYFIPQLTMAQLKKHAEEELKRPEIAPLAANSLVSSLKNLPEVSSYWIHVLKYIVETKPNFHDKVPVFQLVADENRAWHAGRSQWKGWPNLNDCTLGIEWHMPGYAKNEDFYHFSTCTEVQKETGIGLLRKLIRKHQLDPRNIVAHSTIAPNRKTDPGPFFFWQAMKEAGLGYFPPTNGHGPAFGSEEAKVTWVQNRLRAIGFSHCPVTRVLDKCTVQVLDAYRMQFLSQEAALIVGDKPPVEPVELSRVCTPLLLASLAAHEPHEPSPPLKPNDSSAKGEEDQKLPSNFSSKREPEEIKVIRKGSGKDPEAFEKKS